MREALAIVDYNVFRNSPENNEKYGRAFWYKSNQERLINLVGEGGTLWVVTSLKRSKNEPRVYSLAYRLRNCTPLVLKDDTKDQFGKYGVKSVFKDADHYGFNHMNEILMALNFKPKKPIKSKDKIGYSIQTIRELSDSDAELLNRYAEKVKFGKQAFISYSSKDRNLAAKIYNELMKHGHGVWMDFKSIESGDVWKNALNKALQNSIHMIVIISENSSESDWVKKEIKYALDNLNKPNGFKSIIPICIDEKSWYNFTKLHEFQRLNLEILGEKEMIKKLVNDLKNKG